MQTNHSIHGYADIQYRDERNDCVVRAISVAGCLPYTTVHETLKRHGRRDKRGTPLIVSRLAIQELFPRAVNINKKWSKRYSMTLNRFLATHREGHWLCYTSNHAFAVCDGVVYDWSLRSRCRIVHAWRLDV